MTDEEQERDQNRGDGVVVDLERLQQWAEELFLHRFVESIKKARGEHGRYLVLRSGDELAIQAAADGSAQALQEILIDHGDELPDA